MIFEDSLTMPSTEKEFHLNTIEEAIADIRAGRIIIVVDDEDRENEGDFICAAELITPEMVNFMATHGRGLICTPIEEKRAEELDLKPMVPENTALHETAFTVSIDLLGHGCSTGISAYDRATGIRWLTNSEAVGRDFARPGHIFPLRAKAGGVLRRTGHTEAAIDLARMAGLNPAGVLVEILNEDGTMARLPQLVEIAGGKSILAENGKHSPFVNWETIVVQNPDILLIMPCGFTIARTLQEIDLLLNLPDWNKLKAVINNRIYIADGNAYFNRSGPRLVDSIEILAEIINPKYLNFGYEGKGWIKFEC